MKKSGYKTAFHIYLIFFLALLIALIMSAIFVFSVITVKTPTGSSVLSDYPKDFTENFSKQIIFINDSPQIKQDGIDLLQTNEAGIQVLDSQGNEIVSYQRPENVNTSYSYMELLRISQTGHFNDNKNTAIIGSLTYRDKEYWYIIYFPIEISKVTMYLNGERFTTGKTIVVLCMTVLFVIILTAGIIYGFWVTRAMNHLSVSIKEIANRCYLPITSKGSFRDVFESLNDLDGEIKTSDKLRMQTEKMREEWIANITHDLKTPLSPIKGYAEIMSEHSTKSGEQIKKYSEVILKNASCMELLIEDLKLTYQLENNMLPMQCREQNFIRFLKELVIDVLNNPEYENRMIHFDCSNENISFSFDNKLMARAFQNLIINAFAHGNADTQIVLQISVYNHILHVIVSDNGNGMRKEEVNKLFDRYYRGTNTEQKTAGTGLGLAITKSIIESHGGAITVDSEINIGTSFKIQFPMN
jgi:signal transduction histidine kinase